MKVEYKDGEEIYACKDCKYFELHWADRLFGKYDRANCLHTKEIWGVYDPISGKKTEKVSIMYCEHYREDFGDRCGEKGKYWIPRDKNDLFKLIRKAEEVDSSI